MKGIGNNRFATVGKTFTRTTNLWIHRNTKFTIRRTDVHSDKTGGLAGRLNTSQFVNFSIDPTK